MLTIHFLKLNLDIILAEEYFQVTHLSVFLPSKSLAGKINLSEILTNFLAIQ